MDFRPLACTIEPRSGTLVVSGSVDESCVDDLREAIDEGSEHYTDDLTIDLGDVDFLPSMAIGVLTVAMRQTEQNGRRIDLVAPETSIAGRVLQICGLPISVPREHQDT